MRENKLQWCCAMSLMVLCRCLNVQHVMDLWPQLVQQCCPRFIAFLRDPGVDVTDDELLPPPPPPVQQGCSAGSAADGDSDSGRSDDSGVGSACSGNSHALHLKDLRAEEGKQAQNVSPPSPLEHQPHHFRHSLSLLSREQRRLLFAAKCLMTRAGVATSMQQDVVCACVEHMGAHVHVHTDHVELSNGKR